MRLLTFLAMLLVTLGAFAGTGRAPSSAMPPVADVAAASSLDAAGARSSSGPRHAVADAGAASQSGSAVEALDVQGDADDRAEALPVGAADLRLPARVHAWAMVLVSRTPAPWLAGPRRPPRPLDA